ncbi:metalloregulator ArsR/SmtB family transcription factor [Magnetospirillum sp. 64-120]|uniref:ArsR/SmtB family transcription factor n=1 Tax=Magnetospirillum sp. 64-120 TaxID=1895778 RepID=UPI0025C07BFB|nr:metalloregulator ArsR/SmtB family transcription factor [Magnetospirillum sp. 64-120]
MSTYIIGMDYQRTIFSALADPIRLRCLALMANAGELCVCEFTHALDAPQPKVSKHLAVLREAGLVGDRRDAQWVLYSLNRDVPDWVAEAVAGAVKGVAGEPLHREDVRRLETMTGRPPRHRAA